MLSAMTMGIPRRQVLSPMRLRTASSANVSRRPGITVPFPNPVLTLFGHTGDRPMRDQGGTWHGSLSLRVLGWALRVSRLMVPRDRGLLIESYRHLRIKNLGNPAHLVCYLAYISSCIQRQRQFLGRGEISFYLEIISGGKW